MRLFFLGAMLLWMVPRAHAVSAEDLQGHWFYFMKIYNGQELPEPPESTLRLHFEFDSSGRSHLYWWYEGESAHCARRGEYSVSDDVLTEKVTWVDPENTWGCSSDPDMQLGRVTHTKIELKGGNLFLHLHIGDDPLLYVWRKLP